MATNMKNSINARANFCDRSRSGGVQKEPRFYDRATFQRVRSAIMFPPGNIFKPRLAQIRHRSSLHWSSVQIPMDKSTLGRCLFGARYNSISTDWIFLDMIYDCIPLTMACRQLHRKWRHIGVYVWYIPWPIWLGKKACPIV